MSRIRSVHPKLWTDEDFVSLPMADRLFLIGLWGEADDYGVFEWKPLGLKMRLAPADAVDAALILENLEKSRFIVRIERNGRLFGVVKNFRKFQRPKNPSAPITPVDAEIAAIIAIDFPSPTPALPQPYPSPTEITLQMEDGGDKMEDGNQIDNPISLSSTSREPAKQEARHKFPPDGSIAYGLFAEISRRVKPGVDPDVVANAFRRFCNGADPPIELDDPRIVRRFEGFAKSHRISGH